MEPVFVHIRGLLCRWAGWTLNCRPFLMLRYTADDLWALRRDDLTPPRCARKAVAAPYQRELQTRRLRRGGFSHSTPIDRTTTGICFGLLNVRSVAKRSIALSDIITTRYIDVFALTETWHQASDDLSLKRCAPPGYSIVDAARCQTETRRAYPQQPVHCQATQVRRETFDF